MTWDSPGTRIAASGKRTGKVVCFSSRNFTATMAIAGCRQNKPVSSGSTLGSTASASFVNKANCLPRRSPALMRWTLTGRDGSRERGMRTSHCWWRPGAFTKPAIFQKARTRPCTIGSTTSASDNRPGCWPRSNAPASRPWAASGQRHRQRLRRTLVTRCRKPHRPKSRPGPQTRHFHGTTFRQCGHGIAPRILRLKTATHCRKDTP
jgi:hypothetical protein